MFKEPANLLDLSSGVGAAILARYSVPVAWWSIFVGVSWLANTSLSFFVSKKQNPLLLHYLEITGLQDRNLSQSHTATRNYFRRQTAYGTADAAFAILALGGGRAFGVPAPGSAAFSNFGHIFNSAIHVRSVVETAGSLNSARRLTKQQRSIWEICDDALLRSDSRVLNDWLKRFKEIKWMRVGFRVGHSLLPAEPNNVILGMLATATGIRIGAAWTVGDFYQNMAQHVHFKAYQESRMLPRSARQVYLRSGGGIRIPPAGTHRLGARSRPYTSFIRAIFTFDPIPYSDTFVDDLIRDPAGWNAIAHRFVVL